MFGNTEKSSKEKSELQQVKGGTHRVKLTSEEGNFRGARVATIFTGGLLAVVVASTATLGSPLGVPQQDAKKADDTSTTQGPPAVPDLMPALDDEVLTVKNTLREERFAYTPPPREIFSEDEPTSSFRLDGFEGEPGMVGMPASLTSTVVDAEEADDAKVDAFIALLQGLGIDPENVSDYSGGDIALPAHYSPAPDADVPLPKDRLAWPTDDHYITSPYGPRIHPFLRTWGFHTGIDMADPCGSPIYAAADGVVYAEGLAGGGYGGRIVLDHGDNLYTTYSHMDSGGIFVKQGQKVKKGQVIAAMGNTGFSTGCHLHFEVVKDMKFVSPLNFLNGKPTGVQTTVPVYQLFSGWAALPSVPNPNPSPSPSPSDPGDDTGPTTGAPEDPSPSPANPTDPGPKEPVNPTTPAPSEPEPTKPEPTDPDPTEPAPTNPDPTEPADPTEPPAPTDPVEPTDPPAPTDPAPSDPPPSEPAPTEPVEPAPTEPPAPTDPPEPTEPPSEPVEPTQPPAPTDPGDGGEVTAAP